MRKSLTYSDPLIFGGRQVIILLILIMNKITNSVLSEVDFTVCFFFDSD